MRFVYISDLDIRGSGYRNISLPICEGLAKRGHVVKVIGLGYNNEEHFFPFSMLPARNFREAVGTLSNISNYWQGGIDFCIVSFDVPVQIGHFLPNLHNRQFKYVSIVPIESDPLMMSWAMSMQEIDKVFAISRFGADEANKVGIPASYIPIGIDSESWAIPEDDVKQKLRKNYGYNEDSFIVFTNADNQERKLLSRSMEIFADFLYDYENVDLKTVRREGLQPKHDAHYIMLTRPNLPVGWNLYDYAQYLGINKHFTVFERGLEFKKLWSLYAISDVHLLASQAEGLGLPVLESMATGVINLGTNCGGIKEQIGDDRGYLIDYDYTYVNPFGNNTRYMASRLDGYKKLKNIFKNKDKDLIKRAREYAESMTWDNTVDVLEDSLLGMVDEE